MFATILFYSMKCCPNENYEIHSTLVRADGTLPSFGMFYTVGHKVFDLNKVTITRHTCIVVCMKALNKRERDLQILRIHMPNIYINANNMKKITIP